MGEFFSVIGFFALITGIVMIISANKKKKPKKKAWIVLGAGFTVFMLGGALLPPTEETEEVKVSSTATDETEKEKVASEENKKAVDEEKLKAEEEKAKAEAEKKENEKAEQAKKKLAIEKEYYINNVKSKVDTQMQMYDEAWNSIWKTTFEGVSNGTVDVYTAYDNMKTLEQRYQTLQSSFPAIPDEELSKENKKLLSEFKSKMRSASMWRAEAAQKAKKMFDEGNFSPSQLDKVKSDVDLSDSEMLSAIVSLTSLEIALGVVREE